MNFFGIDLTRVPQKLGLSLDIVLPLLSVITMFLSTHISMKASGQQMQGSMKVTMYMMPLMYLFFCFTYPAGILSVLRHFQHRHDRADSGHAQGLRPRKDAQGSGSGDRGKAQAAEAWCEEHHHQGHRPKTGKSVEKNLSASEMNKRRLEYARQLDAERYKDERTVPLSELNKQDKQ